MSYWSYVQPETTLEDIKEECEYSGQNMYAVVNSDNVYQGYITLNDMDSFPNARTAGEILNHVGKRNRDIYVYVNTPTDDAKRKLRQKKLPFIPVIDRYRQYEGTIDMDST